VKQSADARPGADAPTCRREGPCDPWCRRTVAPACRPASHAEHRRGSRQATLLFRRAALPLILLVAAASAGAADPESCPVAARFERGSVARMSTSDLVALLTDECIVALDQGAAVGDEVDLVQQELSRRDATAQIVAAFGVHAGTRSTYILFDLVRRSDAPEVRRGLEPLAGRNTGLVSYLALKYFAERGESWALQVLNDHYDDYPVSSAEWASVARLFGTYGYGPAAANLARSLGAASLNLEEAAHESLRQLYPEAASSAPPFDSPAAAQAFWTSYVVRQNGGGPATPSSSPGGRRE
jgi:hypothetical protein